LLFGCVEMFPRDIPVPERFTAGQEQWAVPNVGGGVTLAVSALPMSNRVTRRAWMSTRLSYPRGRGGVPARPRPNIMVTTDRLSEARSRGGGSPPRCPRACRFCGLQDLPGATIPHGHVCRRSFTELMNVTASSSVSDTARGPPFWLDWMRQRLLQ